MKKRETSRKKIIDGIFTIIAPGTPLRSALNRIQEAELGALILLGKPADFPGLIGGGFEINSDYTPQRMYELAKMDGAIILSEDIKKIYSANLQLQPDFSIKTDESGTRHRTADRFAKQTGHLAIAVSERRNKITVYKGSFRYTLNDIKDLIVKASQAMMALEKYTVAIENHLTNLTILEFDNMITLNEVEEVIKKYALLFKMADELDDYILELGNEGRLIVTQYDEIMLGLEDGLYNLIKDYNHSKDRADTIFERIRQLSEEDLLSQNNIVSILGYGTRATSFDEKVVPKGYRMLNTVNRLTKKDIDLVINKFETLPNILDADAEMMSSAKGISKFKAEHIVRALLRLHNTLMMEK